jgi:hypothetical protein
MQGFKLFWVALSIDGGILSIFFFPSQFFCDLHEESANALYCFNVFYPRTWVGGSIFLCQLCLATGAIGNMIGQCRGLCCLMMSLPENGAYFCGGITL